MNQRQELKKRYLSFRQEELEGYTPYRYENSKLHNLPVTLAGTDFGSVLKTSPYWHINGSMPDAGDGEALVGKSGGELRTLSAGDSVSLRQFLSDNRGHRSDRYSRL